MGATKKKSNVLRKAIRERRGVVVPGCHDAMSAKIIETSGFEATQISGFGIAASILCKPDVGLVQMKDVLDVTWNIVQAVRIPVMADVDTGGGNAVNAAWITERLIGMGVAGMNIEDQVFPKRCGHMQGKEVIPAEEMAGKVRACAAARDRLDRDFIINARTDSYATHGLDEAIARCNKYLEAGADLVFIDGIKTRAEIEKAVAAIHKGPLSVNLMDGVTGVKTELIPVAELAKMGVGRVSIPVASIMVMHKALSDFFAALKAANGTLPGQTHWITPFPDFTAFVGLPEYRKLEESFLPKERAESKYSH
jgi:methylisocitrate lyase